MFDFNYLYHIEEDKTFLSMRACEEEMSLLIGEEVEVKFIKEVKCEN